MNRKYVRVVNEKYVLDQFEFFSRGCMVIISLQFLLQSSETVEITTKALGCWTFQA